MAEKSLGGKNFETNDDNLLYGVIMSVSIAVITSVKVKDY